MLNDFHEGTAGEGTEQPPKADPDLPSHFTVPVAALAPGRPASLPRPLHSSSSSSACAPG